MKVELVVCVRVPPLLHRLLAHKIQHVHVSVPLASTWNVIMEIALRLNPLSLISILVSQDSFTNHRLYLLVTNVASPSSLQLQQRRFYPRLAFGALGHLTVSDFLSNTTQPFCGCCQLPFSDIR